MKDKEKCKKKSSKKSPKSISFTHKMSFLLVYLLDWKCVGGPIFLGPSPHTLWIGPAMGTGIQTLVQS